VTVYQQQWEVFRLTSVKTLNARISAYLLVSRNNPGAQGLEKGAETLIGLPRAVMFLQYSVFVAMSNPPSKATLVSTRKYPDYRHTSLPLQKWFALMKTAETTYTIPQKPLGVSAYQAEHNQAASVSNVGRAG
jgi:hypothetical protein